MLKHKYPGALVFYDTCLPFNFLPASAPVADLHISRSHALGLRRARKIAFKWAQEAESELGMTCTYSEGVDADEVTFIRSGVKGTLRVTSEVFEVNAQLGFLLGAFKERIEAEIVKNLDDLILA